MPKSCGGASYGMKKGSAKKMKPKSFMAAPKKKTSSTRRRR